MNVADVRLGNSWKLFAQLILVCVCPPVILPSLFHLHLHLPISVFIGKFLRHFPEANSMEFSAESPLIRRPLLLTNIASQQQKANKNGPSPQFNSSKLFTVNIL
jgi:hypothetical protein